MQPYPHVSISTGRGGDGSEEGVGGDGGNVAINAINLNYVNASPGITRLMSVRARHAEYNSSRKDAPLSCLEGTRVHILEDIMSWLALTEDNAHPVYWLNGLAGIGKSTIATTVAQRAEEKGVLGATFFFSRGSRALRDPHTVFPTLAFQLAQSDNQFKSVIAEALEKEEGIEEKGLLRQLEGLIVNPLLRIRRNHQHPTVIIFDALDECEERGATDILRLLFSHAIRIPFLRIFITSRPEFHISSVFNQFENHKKTILHDVEASVIQQDIELYIRTELAKIPQRLGLSMPTNWTTEAEKHALVERSGKLFIFAATCIRFIGDDRALAPREHLALILGTHSLEGGDPSEVIPYKQLDRLYTRLLRKSLSDSNPRLVQNRFQIVLGSIVLLRQPLPLRSLAKFVEKDMEVVNTVLHHLQSVIIPPYDENDAPRIYHPSFADFITSPSRCTVPGFLIVTVPEQEQQHALRCFRFMGIYLKRDVAGIEDASLLNSEVDGFGAKVANALPPEAQYACQFWGSHMSYVEVGDEKVMGALEEFAMRSLLWWMEAMSLLGSVHTVGRMIQEARRWVMRSKSESTLIAILADAHRDKNECTAAVSVSIPIYSHDTALYKVYFKETSGSIRVLQGMDSQWPRILATFHGHCSPISSIACSKDGLKMASGSYDHSIRLWDVTSGFLIATLVGHTYSVNSVSFSPDGWRLASGSIDLSIRLWDATSGIPIAVLKGHLGSVQSVAFSPDGLQLASGSKDCSIWLWNATSYELIKKLEGHVGSVNSVAFSPDGFRLASGSSDSSIWLWDATLGTPIAKLGDNKDWVRCIAFSPDSSRLVGSHGSSVGLWDSTSGTPIAVLRRRSSMICSVAFSPDGMQLAAGSAAGRNAVAFTPDGLLLAADGISVQLWDPTLDKPLQCRQAL
ncbi:hypothetical protein BS47DRAFT_1437375 [Hydnum rufescens UP504]|uniref:Intraflagellar transport protein 122 homolog n=1 Tax=Hydnum rufescens UP504 TaxID=1448309 RepID=A0A9P6AFK1_9AGAM|nr:hypothetical protein BS47DRAFT_1437375 [Hydnum rufescens UP504]